MSNISLTSSMRSNLLSLKNASSLMDLTQNRLSTGKKANSPIENRSAYYTSQSLTNRANDLTALLDSMGQSISTIKTATSTLDTGLNFLEQAISVAEQAMNQPIISDGSVTRPLEEFTLNDYKVITSEMSASEIEDLFTSGAKLVLAGDITLDRGLNISTANVLIDGNGHSINYTASSTGDAAIKINGSSASANIQNIKINARGEQVYGISVTNGATLNIDNTLGINVSGSDSQKIWFRDEILYNGEANTRAMIDQHGNDAYAAKMCNNYSVGTEADFTQGTWYLPSLGELMDMYGYDYTQMTSAKGNTGTTHEGKIAINKTLNTLKNDKGVDAEALSGELWSSSEFGFHYSWYFNTDDGSRDSVDKGNDSRGVRAFQLIENAITVGDNTPKVGDVYYTDNTWGKAEDYDGSKTIAGVVASVGDDGSVKIMSLKNLGSTQWSNGKIDTTIANYKEAEVLSTAQSQGIVNVGYTSAGGDAGTLKINSGFIKQYNDVITEYDSLINDGSYKGVNLLRNDDISVQFNETRTSKLDINGKDMRYSSLGISQAEWNTILDIADSMTELRQAINSVRNFVSELGNNYSIIQNRKGFTENLINILNAGADNLTLADMNEESANMLALQTRQQLATNALSLASQGAQAVLKLF